jgi:hypothetical protein
MMTGGRKFSTDADALILSNGLIKKNNESNETRPILAINYDLFYNIAYKNIVSDCKTLIAKELKDILKLRDNSSSGFWEAYSGRRTSYTYKGKDGELIENEGEESKFVGEKYYGYHSKPDWNYKVNSDDLFGKNWFVDTKEQSEDTTFKVSIDVTQEMDILTTIFISTKSYYMHDKTFNKKVEKKEDLDNYDDPITITIQINPTSEGKFQFKIFDNISELSTSQDMFVNSVSQLTKDYTIRIKDMVSSLEKSYEEIFDIPLFNDTVIFPFGKVYKYKGLYRCSGVSPEDNIVYSSLTYISKPTPIPEVDHKKKSMQSLESKKVIHNNTKVDAE